MICYSVDDEESFERIKTKWVPEIRANCDQDNPRIVLVGMKSDIRENKSAINTLKKQGKRLVPIEKIETMKKEVGAIAACECSAITQSGLKELFETITKVSLGLLDPKIKKKRILGKFFGLNY